MRIKFRVTPGFSGKIVENREAFAKRFLIRTLPRDIMNFIRNKEKISVSLSARDLTEGREALDRLLADIPLADPPGRLIISSRGSDDCGWTELRAILSLMERARAGGFEVELRLPPGISGPLAMLGVNALPLS